MFYINNALSFILYTLQKKNRLPFFFFLFQRYKLVCTIGANHSTKFKMLTMTLKNKLLLKLKIFIRKPLLSVRGTNPEK